MSPQSTFTSLLFVGALLMVSFYGSHAIKCDQASVVPKVTGCAKSNKRFVQCVSTNNPGARRQCMCILENQDVKDCIGNCLDLALQALCEEQPWKAGECLLASYHTHHEHSLQDIPLHDTELVLVNPPIVPTHTPHPLLMEPLL
eukprot:m.4684 g.4684  ORF g.4684 m.4684 type:complete len:144 (-) comp4551_c0_seq2:842-1273(-)